jgi:hypothetical protein
MKLRDVVSLALQIFAWGGLLFLFLLFLLKHIGILHSPTAEEAQLSIDSIIFSWLFWLTDKVSKVESNLMKEIFEVKSLLKKRKG